MSKDYSAIRASFRALHEKGCFVIPNPWDIGGVRRLEKLGFKALASTSSGFAWSIGREDGEASCDEVLEHLRTLCASTSLPINADFEAGYADEPEDVAKNVSRAIETGIAGLSIEDRKGDGLYPLPLAIARIRAARQAIDQSGEDVLLIGRSEGLLADASKIDEAIERLRAYSAAGANVLYAPGIRELNDIVALVRAVAPKPVNVLLRPQMNVRDLAAVGVRRVSVGGAFARAAWAAFDKAALSVRDEGCFEG